MQLEKHTPVNELHAVLLEACPPNRHGRRSLGILARSLNISPQAVYQWSQARSIPRARLVDLVDLYELHGTDNKSDYMERLLPFIRRS